MRIQVNRLSYHACASPNHSKYITGSTGLLPIQIILGHSHKLGARSPSSVRAIRVNKAMYFLPVIQNYCRVPHVRRIRCQIGSLGIFVPPVGHFIAHRIKPVCFLAGCFCLQNLQRIRNADPEKVQSSGQVHEMRITQTVFKLCRIRTNYQLVRAEIRRHESRDICPLAGIQQK